ncbi:MAG: secondary thiamine-phosphate synthase enzyme YjbQ [Planctomycetota bacterium]
MQDVVADSGVQTGLCSLFLRHTSASLVIQENADPAVKTDVLAKLDQMIPKGEAMYTHAEGNSDAHLKTMLVGTSANILIDQRRLVLGQWQGVYLCEFDGPRERDLLVKIVKLDPTEID